IPFGFLAARNVVANRLIHFLSRRSLDTLRSVDTLIWALIWINVVGLGPFAGALAIMSSDIGAFGKLMSEAIEAADRRPVDGVLSAGGSWGMTLAPAGFGRFINHLLVGNFSFLHSEINAFDPTTGKFRGRIPIDVGQGHTPGGLWTLEFGVGGSNGDPNTLYFTDGINGEANGLFGAIFANGNGS